MIQISIIVLFLQCITAKLNPNYNYETFMSDFGLNYEK